MVAEPVESQRRALSAVVIADDADLGRVVRALASSAGVDVAAETTTVIEAVLMTARHHPDLVVIDELAHDVDPGQAARALRTTRPGLYVVGLCAHPGSGSPAWANAALDRAGLDDLPLVLGTVGRMLDQEHRLLEVESKLDASRGILNLVRREWSALRHDRTRMLVDELAQGLEGVRTHLDAVHEAMRNEASLIQILRPKGPSPIRRGLRPRLRKVVTRLTSKEVAAEVLLGVGDNDLVGRSSRPATARAPHPPVAEATLDAVGDLLEDPIGVRDFDVIGVGDTNLAVVLFERAGDTLVGSARVRGEIPDAVARASLDGLNRFLGRRTPSTEIRL